MQKDNKHYYDGFFYSTFMDPALKEVRQKISAFIKKDKEVIDICCGTGALAFELSKKCDFVLGVELSKVMHNHAKIKKNAENVDFIHADATSLSKVKEASSRSFDYAVISMAFHEMPIENRKKILIQAKKAAKEVIIADYVSPMPGTLTGIRVGIVEFFAGRSHFSNYRSYQENKGLDPLLKSCNLKINSESSAHKGTIRIIKVS